MPEVKDLENKSLQTWHSKRLRSKSHNPVMGDAKTLLLRDVRRERKLSKSW
jgi:hypothetical protein